MAELKKNDVAPVCCYDDKKRQLESFFIHQLFSNFTSPIFQKIKKAHAQHRKWTQLNTQRKEVEWIKYTLGSKCRLKREGDTSTDIPSLG